MFLKPLLKVLRYKKKYLFKKTFSSWNRNEINPASLSAGILWGDSIAIQENLKDYMKEFNIEKHPLLL
jgi:hypothetical protein